MPLCSGNKPKRDAKRQANHMIDMPETFTVSGQDRQEDEYVNAGQPEQLYEYACYKPH